MFRAIDVWARPEYPDFGEIFSISPHYDGQDLNPRSI